MTEEAISRMLKLHPELTREEAVELGTKFEAYWRVLTRIERRIDREKRGPKKLAKVAHS